MSKFQPLGLEDVMPFGKYKGTKIRVLLMSDLAYLEWVCANIQTFELDKQASDKMEGLQEDNNRDEHGADVYPWH